MKTLVQCSLLAVATWPDPVFYFWMLFNRLGYSPGLSKILSHSELIPEPDATLTLTLMRKRYNEIQS